GTTMDVPERRTSTAARFHRSPVGDESVTVTAVPAFWTTPADCTQNVSPLAESTHWFTSVCPETGTRAIAPSRSFPTAYTYEPGCVVIRPTEGAPLGALAATAVPAPALFENASTVID